MMRDKLVSIIVPVYKVELYIRACVESIIRQKYKELEIILVDDGSDDDSGKICDEYAQIDNRIKVIHKINGGLSSARNAGLNICRGEYIAFVDSDDIINPDYIRVAMDIFEKNVDVDVVEVGYKSFYNEKEIELESGGKNIDMCFFDKEQAKYSLAKYIDKVTNISWDKIYKRNLFENIRFPEGKIHEDEFTTYKILELIKKLAYCSAKLYYYRQRPNSIKTIKYNIKRLDSIQAFEERLEFYRKTEQEELYNITVGRYLDILIYNYYSMKRANLESREEYKDIRNKVKLLYKQKKNILDKKNRIKAIFFLNLNAFYYSYWLRKCNY